MKPQNSAQETLSGYSVWARVSWMSSRVLRYPFLVVLVRVCAVRLGRVVVSTAAMRAAETASKSAMQVRQSTFSVTSPPCASAQWVLCASKILSSVVCARISRGGKRPLLSIGISLVKATAKNFAHPARHTPFIAATGCRGRVAPRVHYIIDRRQEHGGSRDEVLGAMKLFIGHDNRTRPVA